MKALVVSNCATSAYCRSLTALFPACEARGAMEDVVRGWAQNPSGERYTDFARFAAEADLVVALDRPEVWSLIPARPGATRIALPSFVFKGLQPDALHLQGAGSALDGGNLHSKIVTVAFVLGRSADETRRAFRREVYDALGYLTLYEREEERVRALFGAVGVDLTEELARWRAHGKFMYTLNHPKVFVLFDILRLALARVGMLDGAEVRARAAAGRDRIEDDLAAGIVWPVYPEVGERLSIAEPMTWRKGARQGFLSLDLPTFIARSFEKLAALGPIDPRSIPQFDLCAALLA